MSSRNSNGRPDEEPIFNELAADLGFHPFLASRLTAGLLDSFVVGFTKMWAAA